MDRWVVRGDAALEVSRKRDAEAMAEALADQDNRKKWRAKAEAAAAQLGIVWPRPPTSLGPGRPKLDDQYQEELIQYCNRIAAGQEFDSHPGPKRPRNWNPNKGPRAWEMPVVPEAVAAAEASRDAALSVGPASRVPCVAHVPAGGPPTKKYASRLPDAIKSWYLKFEAMKTTRDGWKHRDVAQYVVSTWPSLFHDFTEETARNWRRRGVGNACGGSNSVLPAHALVEVARALQVVGSSGVPLTTAIARPLAVRVLNGMGLGALILCEPQGSGSARATGKVLLGNKFLANLMRASSMKYLHENTDRKTAEKDEHETELMRTNLQRKLVWTMNKFNVQPEHVWNFDETGVSILCGGKRGWVDSSMKKVAFIGTGDKRQWTALVGTSMAGGKTLCQLLLAGSTPQCLLGATPPVPGVTHDYSPSHWTTEDTYIRMVGWVERNHVPAEEDWILLADCCPVHIAKVVRDQLRASHPRMHMLFVPKGWTGLLQPCDLALCQHVKWQLRQRCADHLANLIFAAIRADESEIPKDKKKMDLQVDTRLSALKGPFTRWVNEVVAAVPASVHHRAWKHLRVADEADFASVLAAAEADFASGILFHAGPRASTLAPAVLAEDDHAVAEEEDPVFEELLEDDGTVPEEEEPEELDVSEKDLLEIMMTEHVVKEASAASSTQSKPSKRELAYHRLAAAGLLRKPPPM